jgi:hypothetical protein
MRKRAPRQCSSLRTACSGSVSRCLTALIRAEVSVVGRWSFSVDDVFDLTARIVPLVPAIRGATASTSGRPSECEADE